ncbi:hypothetical protein HMN09_00185500 [Mycena chlorophos]|uniref:Transmembrane protein n=1 Tax=Mycena chlorophos TaxID=658473 RepID=A0A8H6WL11_MYCCL|nr:hypothetical protein HMN09_00185500 [Mycena chlorophos]
MGRPRSFPDLLLSLSPLLLLLLVGNAPSANGAVTNTTFDNTSPKFTFSGGWTAISPSSPCDYCSSKPDASQTYNQTWEDGNYASNAREQTTGTFTFTGSAVYIYGIDQATSQPNIVFTLGDIQSTHHYTGTEQFAYNALFFSAAGLDASTEQTVSWVYELDQSTGVSVQEALFDYAVVTSGTDNAAAPNPDVTTWGHSFVANIHANTNTNRTFNWFLSAALFIVSFHHFPLKLQLKRSRSLSTNAVSLSDARSSSPASSPSSAISGAVGTSSPETQSNTSHTSNNTGTIVGGLLAALFAIGLALIFFFLCRRRAQRQRAQIDAERAAAGLPPLPPQPMMRRIQAGNYTLHPFVQDNQTGPTGNVFAQSALASSSNNASASALVPLRRDTLAAGAAANSSSAEGANEAAAVAGASATEQYPIEKTPLPQTSTNNLTRQPSQAHFGYSSTPEKQPLETPVDTEGSTLISPGDSVSAVMSSTTSARERYLEERLAMLEAHVAQYMPPPYEHSEEGPPPAA